MWKLQIQNKNQIGSVMKNIPNAASHRIYLITFLKCSKAFDWVQTE